MISRELMENYPTATILALNGMGTDADRVIVTYHKDYSGYTDFVKNTKTHPSVVVDEIKSFLVDLNDKTDFVSLTFSLVANYLQKANGNSR